MIDNYPGDHEPDEGGLETEFLELASNPMFVSYMEREPYSRTVQFRQANEALIEVSSHGFPIELKEILFFDARYKITNCQAEYREHKGEWALDFRFSANGRDFRLTSSNSEVRVITENYDGNELVYRLPEDLDWRLIQALALVHVDTPGLLDDREVEHTVATQSESYKRGERIVIGLEMLGLLIGLTSHSITRVIDGQDYDDEVRMGSSFEVTFTNAIGIDYDFRSVSIDMNHRLADHTNEVVSLVTHESESGDEQHHGTSCKKMHSSLDHSDWLVSRHLFPDAPRNVRTLDPSKDYSEWKKAVIEVMAKLKPHYSRG